MIMSNEYDRVLPMDILPEYLIKAIIAGDIDRMEQLGIYEVAPEDFALCEFVFLKISLSASSYVLRRWNFSVSFAKVLTCSVVKCANEFFS